jgi:DNA primase
MSQVNEIKDAVNIVDVIGERIDLKRSGANYKALCPFHSESTPSFFVNPQIQRYKCFGCGASGDVIEFLEQYEGMTFLEALQTLADRAGIELEHYTKSKDDEIRETLLEILQWASKYYHFLLTEHEQGDEARTYLKKRGIHQSSIKLFKLGYALPAWDGLYNYLTKKKKFKPELILKTGLIIKHRTGRYYDRFRNRVVFPLKNHRGQIVGFSGRIIHQTDKEQPKYINTPETQLYHKAKTLYGYSELFQKIREKKAVVVCEGEFDVISSHQVHVSHVVAIKGSALTQDQARLLERTVDKVILSLDADEAGIKATKRAIEVIKGTSLDLRAIDLSTIETDQEIKDADDLIHYDPQLWKEAVQNSISAYDFLINVNLRRFDANTAVGRRQIIDELAPVLNNIPHKVEQDFYLKKLADKLNVSTSILAEDIRHFGQDKSKLNQGLSGKNRQSNQELTPSAESQLEDFLLFLLFNSESEEVEARAQQLQEIGIENAEGKKLLNRLLNLEKEYSLERLARDLPEDLKAALMEWSQHPQFLKTVEQINIKKVWNKTFKNYQQLKIRKKIKLINQKIEKLEHKAHKTQAEENELNNLLTEIVKLQHQFKTV